MDFDGQNGFLLEPGPAAFYLPAEESLTGVEEELFKFDIPSSMLNNCCDFPFYKNEFHHTDLSKEKPLDVQFSLDDFKAEGIDLAQLISVNYDTNGAPIYSIFVESSEEEGSDNEDIAINVKYGKSLTNWNNSRTLLKTSNGTPKFKKKYVCSKCKGKALVGLDKVLRHMLKNHCNGVTGSNKTRTYLCTLCDSILSTESSLKKHIRNVHFRMESFECPVCKKQIQQRSHLRRHIEKIHGGRKALKRVLKQARDITNQNKAFFRESESKHDATNPSPMLNGHGIMTPRDPSSKLAMNDIDGLFGETQQCPRCGILCTSRAHLALHMKDSHHMNMNQILNILKEVSDETVSPLNGSLEPSTIHNKLKTSSSANTIVSTVCPICAAECIDSQGLQAHIQQAHRYLTEYKCQSCISNNKGSADKQMFFSQAVLDAHIEDVHKKQNEQRIDEYKCEHCKNAKFAIFHSTSSSEMLEHVQTSHAYGCAQCPKHFSTTGGLKHHYKKAHFTEFTDIDNTKIVKNEKSVSKKLLTQGVSFPNQSFDVEKVPERSKLSESGVDTGDEVANISHHLNSSSTATINSEDKAINPQILAQIRIDVEKIVDRIKSSGGDLNAIPCDFCRSTETHEDAASLLHHICTEHPYRCIYCPEKMVKLPTSMRKHFRKYHRDETPYFCRFCTAVFVCQGDANQHSLNAHSGEKNNLYRTTSTIGTTPPKVVSPELAKKNLGADEVRQGNTNAMSVGKDVGSGLCIVCDKDFGDLRNLSDHVQETHNYICEVCNREYKLADSIRKHCRKDHSDYYEEPIVCCRFCPTIFHNIPAKQEHIAKVHGIRMSGGKYLAPMNTSLNQESLTSSSISSPTPVESLPHTATTTKVNSPSKDNLEIQENGPMYKCPHCPKGYEITDSLRKHAKNAHNVALGFCRDCKLVFDSHEEKTGHMDKTHGQIDALLQENFTNSITSPSNDNSKRQSSILKYLSPSSSEGKNTEKDTFTTSPTTPIIIGMSKSGYGEVSIEDAYQCPKCPKIYAIGKSLRKHCRKVHDELSICFCASCTTVFVSHDERDRHVAEGQCKGFRNNASAAPASTIEPVADTKMEAAPSMGTRKRRCSALNDTPESQNNTKTNMIATEPNVKIQRSGSYINTLSSPSLTTLQHPSVQSITLQSNDRSKFVANTIISTSSQQLPSSTVTLINNVRGKIVSPVMEISSGVSKVPTTVTSQVKNHTLVSSGRDDATQEDYSAQQIFQCEFCEISAFNSKPSLEEHWMEYHPFGCTLCPKRYKLASSIRRHMHEVHHKKEIFVCHTCTQPFFSFGDKQKHLPSCKPLRLKSNNFILNSEKLTENVSTLKKGNDSNATDTVVETIDNRTNEKEGVIKQTIPMKERTGMRASPRLRNDALNAENRPMKDKTEGQASSHEISTQLVKNAISCKTEPLSSKNVTLVLDEGNEESKLRTIETSKQDDTSKETTIDRIEPGSNNKLKYTKSLPLSPLNFHGFRKPVSEIEIVQGLGDFRDGLNAYATEYFIEGAVFNTKLFESCVVTDSVIVEDGEESATDVKNVSSIVPETGS